MEQLTCVIDAKTLVDRIHEVKQWVYNDTIRIHIPLCTFEKVEQIYQASLVPKEIQIEPTTKKLSSKINRKEISLFDINPLSAREFLLRAQAEDIKSVSFQLPQEQFTQWKEEQKQAIKAEQAPEGPPTSFAQALLRKLNFNNGADSNGAKGPAKPKLVARSSGPKSPWKPHKVPMIVSAEVPSALRSLFSCMLWRLYEFENNPLMPETFVLLSNDNDSRRIAQNLNVPTKNISEIRQLAVQKQFDLKGDRATVGELERDFPTSRVAENTIILGDSDVNTKVSTLADGFDFGVETEQDEEIEELRENISYEKNMNGTTIKVSIHAQPIERDDIPDTLMSRSASKTPTEPAHVSGHLDQPQNMPTKLLGDDSREVPQGSLPIKNEVTESHIALGLEDKIMEPPPAPASPTQDDSKKVVPDAKEDTDDDDEEVVVFKPKSRRSSGLPKSAAEPSRPKTADGPNPVPENHVLTTVAKPHVPTQLKPQSPIFIPKMDYNTIKAPSQLQNEVLPQSVVKILPESQKHVQRNPQDRTLHLASTHPPNHAPNHVQHKPLPQRHVHKPHNLRSESPAQRQSREIIERQREAINRQVQAPPKPAKPLPRQIQMQPTTSPTVIDPDAFDRSYVVQPHGSVSNGANGNHRAPAGRASPRRSPVPKTIEQEVDFVLKSGSPRSSARGRGKLWVP